MASGSNNLGPFRIEERIGRGGMGLVWAARHEILDQPVAIKVITSHFADSPRYRAAFTDEVRAVASLRHRGIVEVFDYGTAPKRAFVPAGSPYLVMARAEASVRERPPTGWADVRAVLLEVLEALAHAHAHGVIHLDLKPGNLLRMGRRVALTDFGVAAFLGESLDHNAIRGSAAYMAPEQFGGHWRDYGPATDLYALGTVAWELLCGEVPFQSEDPTTLGNLKRTSPPPRLPDSVAPPALRSWLEAMLATDAAERYQRAADAAVALAAIPPDADVVVGHTVTQAEATLALSTFSETTWDFDGSPAPTDISPETRPEPAPLATDWRGTDSRSDLLGAALGLGLFGIRPAPFVGREAERDALWRRLLTVCRTRRPAGVLVTGAQGVGSSRLVDWVARRADELGTAIALVRHPHEAPEDLWRRVLLLDGLSPEDQVLHLSLGRARVPQPLARGLAAMVQPGATMAELEKSAIQVQLLEHLAQRRPLVLVLDRLDEAGALAGLARAVVERVRAPVLVLLTARTESLTDGPLADQATTLSDADIQQLALDPLGDESMRTLLERTLHLEGGLSAVLADRCAGNPEVALSALSMWIDADLLIPGQTGFTLRDDGSTLDLGGESWAERVAPFLTEGAVPLELAAALGDRVERAVWQRATAPVDPAVLLDLEEALVRGQLARSTPGGFTFAHPGVRQALLDHAESAGRRAAHHRHLARVLADLGPGWSHERGEHLLAGGLWAAAFESLVSSVIRLWSTRHIQRARRALIQAREAASHLDDPNATLRVRAVEAYFAVQGGRYDEAQAMVDELFERCVPGEHDAVLARVHRARGLMRQRQGRLEEAVADLQLASDHLASEGELDLACTTQTTWMQCLLQLGRYDDAKAVAARFTPVKPPTRASALGGQGILASYLQDWPTAVARFEEALEVARAHGLRVAEAGIAANLGDAYRHLGQLEEAETWIADSIETARSLGLATTSVMQLNHTQLLLAMDQPDRAWEVLEVAISGLEHLGRKAMLGAAHTVALHVLARRADWDRWDHHFAQADAHLAGSGMHEPEIALAYEAAADLAQAADLPDRASAARERAAAQRKGLDQR